MIERGEMPEPEFQELPRSKQIAWGIMEICKGERSDDVMNGIGFALTFFLSILINVKHQQEFLKSFVESVNETLKNKRDEDGTPT